MSHGTCTNQMRLCQMRPCVQRLIWLVLRNRQSCMNAYLQVILRHSQGTTSRWKGAEQIHLAGMMRIGTDRCTKLGHVFLGTCTHERCKNSNGDEVETQIQIAKGKLLFELFFCELKAFEFSHTLAFIFSVIIFLGCALRTSAALRRTEFIRLKTEVKRRKGGKSAMLAEKSDE